MALGVPCLSSPSIDLPIEHTPSALVRDAETKHHSFASTGHLSNNHTEISIEVGYLRVVTRVQEKLMLIFRTSLSSLSTHQFPYMR